MSLRQHPAGRSPRPRLALRHALRRQLGRDLRWNPLPVRLEEHWLLVLLVVGCCLRQRFGESFRLSVAQSIGRQLDLCLRQPVGQSLGQRLQVCQSCRLGQRCKRGQRFSLRRC